jgi:hypothetical protein
MQPRRASPCRGHKRHLTAVWRNGEDVRWQRSRKHKVNTEMAAVQDQKPVVITLRESGAKHDDRD